MKQTEHRFLLVAQVHRRAMMSFVTQFPTVETFYLGSVGDRRRCRMSGRSCIRCILSFLFQVGEKRLGGLMTDRLSEILRCPFFQSVDDALHRFSTGDAELGQQCVLIIIVFVIALREKFHPIDHGRQKLSIIWSFGECSHHHLLPVLPAHLYVLETVAPSEGITLHLRQRMMYGGLVRPPIHSLVLIRTSQPLP